MDSSAFRRFKSLPLPFSDEECSSSTFPSSKIFSPCDLSKSGPRRLFSDLDSLAPEDTGRIRDQDRGSLTAKKFDISLDLNESSVDSGVGLEDDQQIPETNYPTDFEGLISGLLLSSASPQLTKNTTRAASLNTPIQTRKKHQVWSPVSGEKRSRRDEDDDLSYVNVLAKRVKHISSESDEAVSVKCALDRDEQSTGDVIGDFSKPHCLPTIPGKHRDLQCISSETMARLSRDEFMENVGNVTIVDCRYPYEFDGGHIENAVNIWNRDLLMKQFFHSSVQQTLQAPERNIIIFHCEFSSERGPKMLRFLRQMDRDINKESYPALNYPELYLLEGGYEEFFESHKDLCEPHTYKPMIHDDHLKDLKYFRVKSKTWGGEKISKAGHRRRQLKL